MKRILIAGIGNLFMGDDAFGCEVVRRLADTPLPGGTDVVDFGIRGMDLSYALTEGYELAVLVDAAHRDGPPGSVYVIEPDIDAVAADVNAAGEQPVSPHGMDPENVLRFVATLGSSAPRLIIVACEPAFLGGEAGHMGLSDAVLAGVDRALEEIDSILRSHAAVREAGQRLTA